MIANASMTQAQAHPKPMHAGDNPLVADLLQGNRRAMARLISVVENRWEGWLDIMRALHPHAASARWVGITGSAGAGKSCLTAALALELHQRGHKVAVMAIDPSSPLTGGAVLGDRVRMAQLAEAGVYIRSLATRGAMGGLCQSAMDVARILDAAGHDIVLIETVGVGQDEVDIMRMADSVLVVCTPGQGDGVQAIKAGLMEIGDLLIVNKADLPGADQVVSDLRRMLHTRGAAQQRDCPVLRTVATAGQGIGELASAVLAHTAQARPVSDQTHDRFREELLRLLGAALDDCLKQTPALTEANPYATLQQVLLPALQTWQQRQP